MRARLLTLFVSIIFLGMLSACYQKSPDPDIPTVPVTIEVRWPLQAQAFPANGQSLVVTVRQTTSATVQSSVTINRPNSSGTLRAPLGDVIFGVAVYDQQNGQGNALESGNKHQTVVAGQNNQVLINFSGTPTQVRVSAVNPAINVGDTTQATASALDSTGAGLIGPSFTWESSNTAVATVNGSGLVTGVSAGTAEIRARENATGIVGSVSVTVTDTTVIIDPGNPVGPTVDDLFDTARAPGTVLGGSVLGADPENRMTQKNGYLMLPNTSTPGWGRMSYARGPFPRATGYGAIVDVSPADAQTPDAANESLAIGFFDSAAPTNPGLNSNAVFLSEDFQGLGVYRVALKGQLRRDGPRYRHTRRQVVTIVNDLGAFLYAIDMDGVPGGSSHPNMRLIGPSYGWTGSQMYFGVHSRGVSGPFVIPRLKLADTGLRNWWLTSAQAENGSGTGALVGTANATGATWNALGSGGSNIVRTAQGIKLNTGTSGRAFFSMGTRQPYMIGARITTGANVRQAEILFRVQDASNYHKATFIGDRVQIIRVDNNLETILTQTGAYRLQPNQTYDVLIWLNNETGSIRVWLDNIEALFAQSGPQASGYEDRPASVTVQDTVRLNVRDVGVGFFGVGDTWINRLYVHEQQVPIPTSLDIGSPNLSRPTTPVWTDDFNGSAGPLAGRVNSGRTWEAAQGAQPFGLTGSGRVKATSSLTTNCTLAGVPRTTTGDVSISSTILQSPTLVTSFNGVVVMNGAAGSGTPIGYLSAMAFRDPSQGENSTEVEMRYDPPTPSGNEIIWRRVNMQNRFQSGSTATITLRTDGDWVAVWVGSEPIFYHPLSSDQTPLNIQRIGLYECRPSVGSSEFENFVQH